VRPFWNGLLRLDLEMAAAHPSLYAAVGVHPTEAMGWNETSAGELRSLACTAAGYSKITTVPDRKDRTNVVAIGEIGLDYYWDSAHHELQKEILRQQLELAAELGFPVILHIREAKDATNEVCAGDVIKILKAWVSDLQLSNNPLKNRPGVLHSFSGSLEVALEALELGFYIGVTGPVTFKNAHLRQSIVSSIPLEKLLIETDAPFLAPHPHRAKRNEPAFVRLIADKIASLHGCSLDRVAKVTSDNAGSLFGW
jgi:TatD DNase family protein